MTRPPRKTDGGAGEDAPHPTLLRVFLGEFGLLCAFGVAVGLGFALLSHFPEVEEMNSAVNDAIIREHTREYMADSSAEKPHFIFLNIDEATCRKWNAGENCDKGFITPRDQITTLIKAISTASRDSKSTPKLIAIDIGFTPRQGDKAKQDEDTSLCRALFEVSAFTPTVIIRPLTVRQSGGGVDLDAFPTIVDDIGQKKGDCYRQRVANDQLTANIWFASGLLETDGQGGPVRAVHAWDTAPRGGTGPNARIAGIGLLGAALIGDEATRRQAACLFPGSTLFDTHCSQSDLTIAKTTYEPLKQPSSVDRIIFSMPYKNGDRPLGYNPSLLDTLNPDEFLDKVHSSPESLKDAIIVIGGSYSASDDLYQTPLGDEFPGVMVHVNAIDAYANGWLIKDGDNFLQEPMLILIAALLGSSFRVLGVLAHRRIPGIGGALGQIAVGIVGVSVTVSVVFVTALLIGFVAITKSGSSIGTLTPAIAVAIEGLSSIMHEIRVIAETFIHGTSTTHTRTHGKK